MSFCGLIITLLAIFIINDDSNSLSMGKEIRSTIHRKIIEKVEGYKNENI